MNATQLSRHAAIVIACLLTVPLLSGCATRWNRIRAAYQTPAPPATLGTIVDEINQTQEANAERSDFVIYMHEFRLTMDGRDRTVGTTELNDAGKDHVKQIAARLPQHPGCLVLVQRSLTSFTPGTEFEYPVNPNPELDMKRREVIVRALTAMGVPDADQRVVVSHALTPGQKSIEAERDYSQTINNYGGGFGGGFGGFGGGFGGFGGGFGGGGFF
jgi:hypothetical protein